jgi:hypothetical protein
MGFIFVTPDPAPTAIAITLAFGAEINECRSIKIYHLLLEVAMSKRKTLRVEFGGRPT